MAGSGAAGTSKVSVVVAPAESIRFAGGYGGAAMYDALDSPVPTRIGFRPCRSLPDGDRVFLDHRGAQWALTGGRSRCCQAEPVGHAVRTVRGVIRCGVSSGAGVRGSRSDHVMAWVAPDTDVRDHRAWRRGRE